MSISLLSSYCHLILIVVMPLTLQAFTIGVLPPTVPDIYQSPQQHNSIQSPHNNYRFNTNNKKAFVRMSLSEPTMEPLKKLKKKKKKKKTKKQETWRFYGIKVHPDELHSIPNHHASIRRLNKQQNTTNGSIDKLYLYQPVVDALLKTRLKLPTATSKITKEDELQYPKQFIKDIRVVRRSLDARKVKGSMEPQYSYIVDVDFQSRIKNLKQQSGYNERLSSQTATATATTAATVSSTVQQKQKVVIVGAGPAGLFCALTLLQGGITPLLIERGQPVETRGQDIGTLIKRRLLNQDSNFAYGEGGAGTWSDGKLTTRIGRNSKQVRTILETFVKYGAPESILVDGSPHLGTDNLVQLLRNMRIDLRNQGAEIRFGAKVTKFHFTDSNTTTTNTNTTGVEVQYSKVVERFTQQDGCTTNSTTAEYLPDNNVAQETLVLDGDAVVLATGHSAREVYEELHKSGVTLEAKGFAVGFRIEHPQKVINQIRYGNEWGPCVQSGKQATDVANSQHFSSCSETTKHHKGKLPVPSYRLATNQAHDVIHNTTRDVYSFCMCPGGQIVPSSTNPNELCVNGMSFSKRDSLWANSGLVVSVQPNDELLDEYREKHGVMAGIEFQKDMEQRASIMGGGNFTVPVQRLPDFLFGETSATIPSSSYRIGVKSSALHELYPSTITNSIQDAVTNHFEKQMPGYICNDALLHGVETRTSSPVRICRDPNNLQALGKKRFYPTGEGAGFAGGIVSAAVDGMVVAEAILKELS